jgi:hypothetical protein
MDQQSGNKSLVVRDLGIHTSMCGGGRSSSLSTGRKLS